ncbi:MAG: prenyltransferase/squalene oxidase repeat-containing protein [Candidatus Hodarchaeales archaeon]|jgi:prenyltransferase beta subunit
MVTKQGIAFVTIILIIVLNGTLVGMASNHSTSTITTTDNLTSSESTRLNTVTTTVEESSEAASNRSKLDLAALFTYLDVLYEPAGGTVRNRDGGFTTTMGVYQLLSILKLTGMEKYLIPTESSEELIHSANLVSLKVENEGYKITERVSIPSIAGTFGAIQSLQLMNEKEKLDEITDNGTLIPWMENERFISLAPQSGGGFHEFDSDLSFEANFMAITIYETLNESISELIKDNVTTWIVSNWKDGYFDDPSEELSHIVETWLAVKCLTMLNKSGDIVPPELVGFKESILDWLNGLLIESGPFAGSFTTNVNGTVIETATALATMTLLENLGQSRANLNQTTKFFLDSQFLSDETSSDYGGFSNNNLTHDDPVERYFVSMKYSYHAILGLYLTGHLFNNTDLEFTVETKYSRDSGSTYAKNEILQGTSTDFFVSVTSLDYKTFTGLEMNITGPDTTWNITRDISELMILKEQTNLYEYKFMLQNHSWDIGTYELVGNYSLKNFTLLSVKPRSFTINVSVRLGIELLLNTTGEILPGEAINLKILAHNGSEDHDNYMNITKGTLNLTWFMPNTTQMLIVTRNITFPQNYSDFNLTIPENAELGRWKIQVVHYNSTSGIEIIYSRTNITLEVRTEVRLTSISGVLSTNPGKNYHIDLTFAYKNGTFPRHVNATCFFENNATQVVMFNTTVEPVTQNQGKFSLNSTDSIPKKLLFGHYNISVRISWNLTSTEYYTISVRNETLPMLQITGNVVLTDNDDFPEIVTPGQLITFKTNVSILTPLNETYTVEENLTLKANIINSTGTIHQITVPTILESGTGYNYTFNLNPNLERGSYSFELKVLIEINNSYVPILASNEQDLGIFNFTLEGNLQLGEVEFTNLASIKNENYYQINITENGTTAIVNFKVVTGNPEYYVSGLALFANITSEDSIERLPAIAAATESDIYQLIIPLSDKEIGNYTIEIFTVSALVENTLVGDFELGLYKPVNDQPVPPELLVAYFLAGVMILATAINIYMRSKR